MTSVRDSWYFGADPDPTPLFSDFKDAIFFSYNLPAGTYIRSLIYSFKDKFCVKILFSKHNFSPLNTFMRKGKDPNPDPNPQHWL